MANETYHEFDALPEGWVPVTAEQREDDDFDASYRWSGKAAPPAKGSVVKTNVGFGNGVVIGYFAECGWLGVLVQLQDPPEAYVKQNGNAPCHIFGAEIE